jgi:hypothetical protein
VLSPSMEWLRDAARVYPVTIDPTVQLQPWNPMNLGYMPWGNNSGGNSFSAWTNEMIFGNWWGSQWRSYIQFDPTLFAGKTITNATLNMRVQSCDNQTNPAAPYANSIGVHKLTSAYYFGQTWPGASWNGEVWASPAGPNSNSTANITAFAAEWAANSQSNLGLMLDMGSAQGYCRVQRTAPTGQQTFIEVTYNEAPSTVQEYGYLKNFSFENGQSSFQACSRAEAATWSVVAGATPSGLKHAKLRANNAGDVSICQAIVTPVGPMKQYNLIASVRSATGVPISGKVSLLENGPAPANAKTDFTTVGTAWQNVSVSMNGVNAANWGLQTDVFVGSPFTADLDIDYVVLSVSNVPGTPPPPVYPPATTPPPPPATAPPTTVPPAPPGVPYRLNRDQYLLDGGYLISPNGRYRATVTSGNLVVMDMQAPTSVKWTSSSSGNSGSGLLMQGDGNLVMYSNAGQQTATPIWNTYTNGTGAGNYLVMQDDSNLVVYRADGVAVWSWWGGRVQLPNPPAPTGPVIPVVVIITGGGTVIPTTPTAPVGAHLLANGVPTILELSDSVNLDCLVLSGTTAMLTTDKTQCLLVTPFLVPYGFLLGIGDLENVNDAEACLIPSGSSFVSGACLASQDSVVTDVPGVNSLLFPLRRFSYDGTGACVTRSGSSLTFAYCPPTPASNQLWYDKTSAPRTDPCAAYNPGLTAVRPMRLEFADYQFNTRFPFPNDQFTYETILLEAKIADLPGPQHWDMAAKLLKHYLGNYYVEWWHVVPKTKGESITLSNRDMRRVVERGFGEAGRNIAQLLFLDVQRSAAQVPSGTEFWSGGTGYSEPVSKFGPRSGISWAGTLTPGEVGMTQVPGWFRVSKGDNGVPGDYPNVSDGDTNVFNGVGSFDLRTQGKVIGGYKCFKVFLTDYYVFEINSGPAGLNIHGVPGITNQELARLHKAGLARNFDIFGETSASCFIAPNESRVRCPGFPKLG